VDNVIYKAQALTNMTKYQAVSSLTDDITVGLSLWPDATLMSNVLGIVLNTVTAGQIVNILQLGIIQDSNWNWIPQKPIYVGAGGYLTQIKPTTAIYTIAKAVGRTSIFVSPSQLFLLN